MTEARRIRIVQRADDTYPRVELADTGERLFGVQGIAYEHRDDFPWGVATVSFVTGYDSNEVDLTLDMDLAEAARPTPAEARAAVQAAEAEADAVVAVTVRVDGAVDVTIEGEED